MRKTITKKLQAEKILKNTAMREYVKSSLVGGVSPSLSGVGKCGVSLLDN